MIRHIVFFTAEGIERAAAVREGLQALATIPGAKLFEISENLRVDLYDNSIDVVVYAEFETLDAMATFKAHPLYAKTTAAVKPLRDKRYSADIVSAEG